MKRKNLFCCVCAVTSAVAFGDFVWTGAAGDGKWFTAGNWKEGRAPGAEPDEPVVIDGEGFDPKPVVEYVPTGDLKPKSVVIIKNGAKFVQTTGSHWQQFSANGGSLVLDGGIYDIGSSGKCLLHDLTIRNGGVFTNSLNKTLAYDSDGGLIVIEGGYMQASTAELSISTNWTIRGGYFDSRNHGLNLPDADYDFGSAVLRGYYIRTKENRTYTFNAGGFIVGNDEGKTHSSMPIDLKSGSCFNLPATSTARFTIPWTSGIYGHTFGTSSTAPAFRRDGKVLTEAEFNRYVITEPFTYENGTTQGTTFYLRQLPILKSTEAEVSFSGGRSLSAAVDLETAGLSPATLYLCYGLADGGETLAGWGENAIAGETVTAGGVYAVNLSFESLTPGQDCVARVLAVNEYGAVASGLFSFQTPSAPKLSNLAVNSVTEADAVFTVEFSGGAGTIAIEVTDASGATRVSSMEVGVDGTYSIFFEGLSGSTTYTWKATVSNAAGTATVEAAESFVTPGAVPARTAVASGLWNDPSNWSPAGVPKVGNAVTIPDGIVITNDIETSTVEALTVAEGATLVFDGWNALLRAGGVVVNGTLTHVVNSATEANPDGSWTPNGRVNVNCANLTVSATGRIDAKGLGYQGSVAGTNAKGFGPGATDRGPSLYGGNQTGLGVGGSHGGRAGRLSGYYGGSLAEAWTWNVAEPYDSASEPNEPGSGGFSQDKKWGGSGGGCVRIVATGDVTVDGVVDADGTTVCDEYGYSNHWTAGSGGAVSIVCRRFLGAGRVSANGGDASGLATGAGGGRIAVRYDPEAQAAVALPACRIQAMGGGTDDEWQTFYNNAAATGNRRINHLYGHLFPGIRAGESGTLWFPDNLFLMRSLEAGVVRLAGRWASPNAPASIETVGDLVFDDGGLELPSATSVRIGGDLKVLGHESAQTTASPRSRPNRRTFANKLSFGDDCTVEIAGSLVVTNANVTFTGAADVRVEGALTAKKAFLRLVSGGEERPGLKVAGDAILDFSTLYVVAGSEAGGTLDSVERLVASGGALVAVGGRLTLENQSSVFPASQPVTGGSPWFRLGSAAIDATSAFDATALGYQTFVGKRGVMPAGMLNGLGPGGGYGGAAVASGAWGCGGYGGAGANATNVNEISYGGSYGLAIAPFGPGSSGAVGDGSPACAPGAVRIFCEGDFLLNGGLVSRGFADNAVNWNRCPSGGAVWLITRSLANTAATSLIDVTGGSGQNWVPWAAGGGGRIAVWLCPAPSQIDGRQIAKLVGGNLGEAVEVSAPAGWSGTATAAAGTPKDPAHANIITPATAGTVRFLSVPKGRKGLYVILR